MSTVSTALLATGETHNRAKQTPAVDSLVGERDLNEIITNRKPLSAMKESFEHHDSMQPGHGARAEG